MFRLNKMISFNVLFIYEAPHRHLKSDQVDKIIIYIFFFLQGHIPF